jgi:DNA topoisomerase-3
MEEAAIAEGFRALKPASNMTGLSRGAMPRTGGLARRISTPHGCFPPCINQTLHIGRVMAPTLAMIVEREAQIARFSLPSRSIPCSWIAAF